GRQSPLSLRDQSLNLIEKNLCTGPSVHKFVHRRVPLTSPRMGGGFQRLRVLLELLHHGFRRPGIRTLAWRELNHGLHILGDEGAGRQQHKDSICTPLFIVQITGYIRLLEWIGAKVEELRKLQREEWLRPGRASVMARSQ